MKHTLLLCLLAITCFGQQRRNEPLPQVAKSSISELSRGIMGWGQSLDGQWNSEKNLIPYRKISRNSSKDFNKTHQLGQDNMPTLQLVPVVYGNDTLVCLVKHMNMGKYELENIEKSWVDFKQAHYFLFRADQLEEILSAIDNETKLIEIDLLDNGNINNVSPGKISQALSQKIIVNEKCQRQLMITAKSYEVQDEVKGENVKTSMIQFQIHSNHKNAIDLQGVVTDFEINGTSLYGSTDLLNYLYYECLLSDFKEFMTMPAEFKLL